MYWDLCNEDIFGFNVAVEEARLVDVGEASDNLVEHELDACSGERHLFARVHELDQAHFHCFHNDVELLDAAVEKHFVSVDKRVVRLNKGNEDELAQLAAFRNGLLGLFGNFYSNLQCSVSRQSWDLWTSNGK